MKSMTAHIVIMTRNELNFHHLILDSNQASSCCLKVDSECSEAQLLTMSDLEEKELIQLQYIQPDADHFCRGHLHTRIKLFLLHEKICLDPLLKHETAVRKNLLVISMDVHDKYKSRIILVPGRKICKKCLYTYLPEWLEENPSPVSTQITSSSSSEFYCSPGFISSQFEMQKARETIDILANILQLTSIDPSKWSDQVSVMPNNTVAFKFTFSFF